MSPVAVALLCYLSLCAGVMLGAGLRSRTTADVPPAEADPPPRRRVVPCGDDALAPRYGLPNVQVRVLGTPRPRLRRILLWDAEMQQHVVTIREEILL